MILFYSEKWKHLTFCNPLSSIFCYHGSNPIYLAITFILKHNATHSSSALKPFVSPDVILLIYSQCFLFNIFKQKTDGFESVGFHFVSWKIPHHANRNKMFFIQSFFFFNFSVDILIIWIAIFCLICFRFVYHNVLNLMLMFFSLK